MAADRISTGVPAGHRAVHFSSQKSNRNGWCSRRLFPHPVPSELTQQPNAFCPHRGGPGSITFSAPATKSSVLSSSIFRRIGYGNAFSLCQPLVLVSQLDYVSAVELDRIFCQGYFATVDLNLSAVQADPRLFAAVLLRYAVANLGV